jgi:quercetin dioxygenase-like cupin family protein
MNPIEQLAYDLQNGKVHNVFTEREIIHHIAGGVYAKELRMIRGDVGVQHAHEYDHLSISTGRAIVQRGDEVIHLLGGSSIVIKAGVKHAVTALENLSWFCIHAIPPGMSDDAVLEGEIDNAVIQKGP